MEALKQSALLPRASVSVTPCASEEMLREIAAFHDSFLLRATEMSEAAIVERFRARPDAFQCLFSSVDGAAPRLDGYFIVMPLRSTAVAALRSGEITSGRQIEPRHLARRGERFDSIYLSVVCACGARAQDAAIRAVVQRFRELQRSDDVRYVFVRAATPTGARILARLSGSPFLPDGRIRILDLTAYALMRE